MYSEIGDFRVGVKMGEEMKGAEVGIFIAYNYIRESSKFECHRNFLKSYGLYTGERQFSRK